MITYYTALCLGIVPLVCEELFSAITKKRAEANEDEEYKVICFRYY